MNVASIRVTAPVILHGRERQHATAIRNICAAMCAKHGVTMAEILGRSHEHRISHARQEVMWLASMAGKSTGEIGRFFGRDHTTVMHGIRAHQRRMGAA